MIPLIQNTVMMDVMRRGGVMLNMKNQLRSLLCLVDQREGQEVSTTVDKEQCLVFVLFKADLPQCAYRAAQ